MYENTDVALESTSKCFFSFDLFRGPHLLSYSSGHHAGCWVGRVPSKPLQAALSRCRLACGRDGPVHCCCDLFPGFFILLYCTCVEGCEG